MGVRDYLKNKIAGSRPGKGGTSGASRDQGGHTDQEGGEYKTPGESSDPDGTGKSGEFNHSPKGTETAKRTLLFRERARLVKGDNDRLHLEVIEGSDGTGLSPRDVGIDFSLDGVTLSARQRARFVFPTKRCRRDANGNLILWGSLQDFVWSSRVSDNAKAQKVPVEFISLKTHTDGGLTEVEVQRESAYCFLDGHYRIVNPRSNAQMAPRDRETLQIAAYGDQIAPEGSRSWPDNKRLGSEIYKNREQEEGEPKPYHLFYDDTTTRSYTSDLPDVSGIHAYAAACPHVSQPEFGQNSGNMSCGSFAECNGVLEVHYALDVTQSDFDKAVMNAYSVTSDGWGNKGVEWDPSDTRAAAFLKGSPVPVRKVTEKVILRGFLHNDQPYGGIKVEALDPDVALPQSTIVGKHIECSKQGGSGHLSRLLFPDSKVPGQTLGGSTIVCSVTEVMAHNTSGFIREGTPSEPLMHKGTVLSRDAQGDHTLTGGVWSIGRQDLPESVGWRPASPATSGPASDHIEPVLTMLHDSNIQFFQFSRNSEGDLPGVSFLQGYQEDPQKPDEWTLSYCVPRDDELGMVLREHSGAGGKKGEGDGYEGEAAEDAPPPYTR